MRLPELFEAFVRERRYLHNVSPATLAWYGYSWRAFGLQADLDASDLTEAHLKAAVVALASKGLAAVSVNTHSRCLNAFLRWAHTEGHTATLMRIAKLREPALKPATLRDEHIRAIVKWTPRSKAAKQLYVLMLLLLDTGLRISEALALERSAVDWEQSTLTVVGKGRKERTVPVSKEMRRRLYAYLKTHDAERVFTTRDGGPQSIRNVQHAFNRARKPLGIPPGQRFSPHVLRHTFATQYLRRGGDVFRLQRCLGHSSLAMTLRYSHLTVADLCAVHDRFSPLAAL